VEVLTHNGMKTELRVDAQSGQASVTKSKPAKHKDSARLNAASMTLQQAIDVATAQTGGGQALEAGLDSWYGRVSYEVKVLRDDGIVQKVVLDASNGTVLNTH